MKRIVFYIPTLEGGGAERNTVLIANQLAERGHQVFIIVDKDMGPNLLIVKNEVKVLGLGEGSHVGHMLKLRRVIKKIKPDAIFVRIGLCPIKIFPAVWGVMTWRSIILSYHNLFDPKSKLGGRMTYVLASLLTRMAGATFAVSGDIRDELVHHFYASRKKIRVIYNPVNIQWVESSSHEKHRVCDVKSPYLLSAGRLVYIKNYSFLIHAFCMIKDRIPHDLVILGDGPLRKELENLVANLGLGDRVKLPGYQTNPFPIFRHADLFILPSRAEGFGNVLVEALAIGVPVVATRCPGGPKDILDNGKYGFLVELDDPKALGEAILKSIKEPVEPLLLKKRAADFNVSEIAQDYLDLVSG